jgi:hypothetical protein
MEGWRQRRLGAMGAIGKRRIKDEEPKNKKREKLKEKT